MIPLQVFIFKPGFAISLFPTPAFQTGVSMSQRFPSDTEVLRLPGPTAQYAGPLNDPQKLALLDIHCVPRWKRNLDITCILLAIPILLPVAFLIALATRFFSPGPILFRQQRIGLSGRPFT